MDAETINSDYESRPPTIKDLLSLCKWLNEKNAKYIVIGGMAIIQAGLVRATKDIDILIESSLENQKKVKEAFLNLPDQAIKELGDEDLKEYTVVRVADEILVDILVSATGISFKEAEKDIEYVTIENIEIPLANIDLLYKMKNTFREEDKIDRLFLEMKIRNRGKYKTT